MLVSEWKNMMFFIVSLSFNTVDSAVGQQGVCSLRTLYISAHKHICGLFLQFSIFHRISRALCCFCEVFRYQKSIRLSEDAVSTKLTILHNRKFRGYGTLPIALSLSCNQLHCLYSTIRKPSTVDKKGEEEEKVEKQSKRTRISRSSC